MVPGMLAGMVFGAAYGAAAGAVAAMATIWVKTGRPDVGMAGNGALAGLVSITAGCAALNNWFAVLAGAIGGVLVVFAVLFFDKRGIDDPVGAISVHGVCGAWGTLAVGLFATKADGFVLQEDAGLLVGGGFDQLWFQIVGIVEPQLLEWDAAGMVGVTVHAGQVDAVARQLAQFPEVSYLFMASGGFDLFVEVYCRDREHFVSFLSDTLQQVPGVERTETFMILKMYKLSYRWGEAEA